MFRRDAVERRGIPAPAVQRNPPPKGAAGTVRRQAARATDAAMIFPPSIGMTLDRREPL